MTIYHLGSIDGFLAQMLFPKATFIAANPKRDTAHNILSRITQRETEFLYHLDVTFSNLWPAFRDELDRSLCARGVRIYNTHATDLSRRTLQRAMSAAGCPTLTTKRKGPATETLIVRPDFNYRGLHDLQWHAQCPTLFPRIPQNVSDFEILHRRDIPAHLWESADVQIERFVTNPEHKYYRVCFWKNRAVVTKYINTNPIKKASTSSDRERFLGSTRNKEIARAISVVKRVAKQMRFDFGAADVLADAAEELYVCDLNSTPHGAGFLGADESGKLHCKTLLSHLRGR